MTASRFHLSFCVSDLEATRRFYEDLLPCPEGRSGASAIAFSFWSHQITCHLAPERVRAAFADSLDGNHFGAIIQVGVPAGRGAAAGRSFIPAQPQPQWRASTASPLSRPAATTPARCSETEPCVAGEATSTARSATERSSRSAPHRGGAFGRRCDHRGYSILLCAPGRRHGPLRGENDRGPLGNGSLSAIVPTPVTIVNGS